MALDRDKVYAAIAAGQRIPIYKASVANMAAGYLTSLWRAVGSPLWGQGAIPGAAATPTDTTAGGISLPDFGSATGRIYRFAPIGVTIGSYMLYDRLAHMGGLVANIATEQTVNLDAATAIAAGRANDNEIEWYIEIYTDIGTTASNLTVTYRDINDLVDKTITITGFTGASPLNRSGRLVQLVPADGIQIKRVVSVQHSVTSGTAGSYGITARRQLCSVGQMIANIQAPGTDAISLGLPEIKSTTCLEMLVQCSTTSTGIIQGDLKWGQVVE
jgi:hypothetical protein